MPYIFDCSQCANRCDGRSIGVYNFQNDLAYSEHFENMLIDRINEKGYYAVKTQRPQYPDIEVYDREGGKLFFFLEVKAQRRTFMSVSHLLRESRLTPSETVALNQSDLEHYIAQSRVETAPIYLTWILSNRPCIVPQGQEKMFYNDIGTLESIFKREGAKRRFRRASGVGDVVDGVHNGVVVDYHFSLNELKPLVLEELFENK